MKEIWIFFLCLFAGTFPVFAQNEITFIYLNGSNTNTVESKNAFIKDTEKLHKQIYLNFENDEFVQNILLKNGKYKINAKPVSFYWGDLSKNDIQVIEDDFNLLKKISPKPANYVRNFIGMCLHDAIWVSKPENMYNIVGKLHKYIMNEFASGNKVVLTGYSAGTFIVHQYLFLKAPIIDLKESINRLDIKTEHKDYISNSNIKPTCADAVFNSRLVTYDIGHSFVFEDDDIGFRRKIDSLNDYTDEFCTPPDVLAGGINFASPFALFYSEIFDTNYKMSGLMALSYKYIVENNIFWLTVNYSDDPLGFPTSRNLKFDEIQKMTGRQIRPAGGFIYDKSDKTSRRTFLMAHLAYFKTARRYAKILSDALDEGHEYFYK